MDSSVSSINPSAVNAKAGVSPYFHQGDIVVTELGNSKQVFEK